MALVLVKPQAIRQCYPFTFPSIPVDVEINHNQLAYVFERINKEWKKLGEGLFLVGCQTTELPFRSI
jgi:hypothetical protein